MSEVIMDDDEEVEGLEPAGIPPWVMTFADLMSLLMCFFVLLLSFSQMDLSKFKKIAGSMEHAFGVQREVVAYEIPKGTSIIAKEFSPGKPQPTALTEVRQSTIQDMRNTLDYDQMKTTGDVKQKNEFEFSKAEKGEEAAEDGENSTAKKAAEIAGELVNEIMDGIVEVEATDQRIIIRILEQGSFASGEDVIRPSFVPVIYKISRLLENLPGKVTVAGHTDDEPIYTARFRSNWELSTARAVSVAHYLFDGSDLDKNRVTVSGYADTKPLFDNDSKEHRAHNRRVEIELVQNEQDSDKSINKVVEQQKSRKRSNNPPLNIQTSTQPADNTQDDEGQAEPVNTFKPFELFKFNFNQSN